MQNQKIKFTIPSDPLVLIAGCCLFSFAIPPRNRQGMENLDLLLVVLTLGQSQKRQRQRQSFFSNSLCPYLFFCVFCLFLLLLGVVFELGNSILSCSGQTSRR